MVNPESTRTTAPPTVLALVVVAIAVLAVSHGAIFARMAAAPALAIAAWRLTFATAVLALILPWHWQSLRATMNRRVALMCLGASVCLALHFATWITSLQYTSVSNSVILVNTAPIWVALFGRMTGSVRLTPKTLGAIALAVAGAAIIGIGGHADSSASGSVRGDLLALAGGAAMGAYLLFARVARLQLPLVPYIFCCYSAAAIVLWGMAIGSEHADERFQIKRRGWRSSAIAVIPQLLGHSSYNWSLRFLHPSTVSITLLGEGVVGSALAFIYFGEAVPRRHGSVGRWCSPRSGLPPAKSKKHRKDAGVEERLARVRFHFPVVVPDAEHGDHINEFVQLLPTTPESAHHRVRRCYRQREQQHEGGKSDRDIGTLRDVLEHGAQMQRLIENEIDEKVQQGVGKREEPEHSSQAQPLDPPGDIPQGRDAERQQ